MALPLQLKLIQMNNQTLKNSQGFTLIEMMVAVSIFSIVILAATGILNYVLKGQVASVASQNVQESMRYALEVMSKEIRTAQIANNTCYAAATKIIYSVYIDPFQSDPGTDSLRFKNKDGNCVLYYVKNKRLIIQRDNFPTPLPITPDEIEITDLKFKILDDNIGAFHTVQPLVVMSMDVKSKNTFVKDKKVRIETAVSSRYYR